MAVFNDDISINSIIGNGSSIRGDIKINGFMRIDGDLEGNLETTGNVLVGENARIAGNITARSRTGSSSFFEHCYRRHTDQTVPG